jgi:hypothetical protein
MVVACECCLDRGILICPLYCTALCSAMLCVLRNAEQRCAVFYHNVNFAVLCCHVL